MTVSWTGYTPFDPGVARPLHEVPKREALAAFDRLMIAKLTRIVELRTLLQTNGIALLPTDEGVQQLNDWFASEVEGDRESGRLVPRWYAVVNDVALFLGDLMIERSPGLRWAFFDQGARDVAFQRHVIMGFTRVANPKYNIDIDGLVATYGHRIVAGNEVDGCAFVSWLHAAQSKA